MNNKKIILCTSEDSKGGIARVSTYIKNWLKEHDCFGTEVVYQSGPLTLLDKVAFTTRVIQQIGTNNGIIFSHMHLARIMSMIPNEIPYLVLTHGLEIEKDIKREYGRVLNNAATVLVNSRYTQKQLLNNYTLINVQQCYYPTGLTKKSIPKLPKFTSPTVLIVGYMRSAERYKGHDRLINIWPAIVNEVPDARLLIAGSGNDQLRYQQTVCRAGLEKHVRFLGEVSDDELVELYVKSWIFCMPSTGEGQGLVYNEAQYFGLPIVALNDTPAEELVVDGETGVLINTSKIDELGNEIISLLKDDKKRTLYSQKAGKHGKKLADDKAFELALKHFVEEH